MAVACASRFAVLKLEDDDVSDINTKQITQTAKVKGNVKQPSSNNESKSKTKKKKKTSNEISELQSLAFSSGNTKHKGKSQLATNAPKCDTSSKQWEEWKQKDKEFVFETYEQDLQEAILQSKIDYEEKKDVYEAVRQESEQAEEKKKRRGPQKKGKPGTMSLDEFQNMGDGSPSSPGEPKEFEVFYTLPSKSQVEESNFFEDIKEDTEKILIKEQKQKSNIDPRQESARLLQCREDLREKDEEIAQLRALVEKLKEELKNVKMRNKKLYGILESGEMREKAEILLQIDDLTSVKDELMEQVNEYHASLEQERSKVHALQTELKKYQGKKPRLESK